MLAPYPVHADTLCKVAREKTKKSCVVVKSILVHEMVVASLITAVKLTWLFAVWLGMASTSVPDIGLLFSFCITPIFAQDDARPCRWCSLVGKALTNYVSSDMLGVT